MPKYMPSLLAPVLSSSSSTTSEINTSRRSIQERPIPRKAVERTADVKVFENQSGISATA